MGEAVEFGEAIEKGLLRLGGSQRPQIVDKALERQLRRAEKLARLGDREAGERVASR